MKDVNYVYFVLGELKLGEHGGYQPTGRLLRDYAAQSLWFVEFRSEVFDPFCVLKFDSYRSARVCVDLIWQCCRVKLGIAIWETANFHVVDFSLMDRGEDVNVDEQMNRERH